MKRGIESVAVATYVNWTTSALLANSQDRVRGRIEADKNAYSPNENAKLRLSPGRDQHPRMCALTVSPTEESVRCTVLRHSVTEAVGQPGSRPEPPRATARQAATTQGPGSAAFSVPATK